MPKHPEFHNIDDASDAIVRQLAEGLSAHVYPGDQAMISIVTAAPNSEGKLHHHPEEQWEHDTLALLVRRLDALAAPEGLLDDVRLWAAPRTAQDVQASMHRAH